MIRARSRWNSVRNAWPGSEFWRPRESPDFSANGASTARSLASISPRVLKKGARRGAGGSRECLVTIDFPILFVDLSFRNLKSDMTRKTARKKSARRTAGRIRRGEQVTPERLMELSFAYAPPLIISAGVSNQVFDSLEDGAKTPEQVAEKTGASARALRILMNALVGLDLLKKDRQGKYSLTPESAAFLLSKNPGAHAGFFGTIAPQLISRWLRLSDIVREGRPTVAVNQETEGTEFFSQLVENIIPLSYPPAQKLADHLKLAKTNNDIRVLDLAAGSGIWGIALAQQSPALRVTAVDWAG